MNINNADKKFEADKRLAELKRTLHISKRVLKGFEEDKIYYSYVPFVGNAKIAVLNKKYLEIIDNFQKKYNCLVYHAIVTYGMIALLFVGDDKENWEYERLENDYIFAYVYNMDNPDCSEFGDIFLTSDNGALVRTDVFI